MLLSTLLAISTSILSLVLGTKRQLSPPEPSEQRPNKIAFAYIDRELLEDALVRGDSAGFEAAYQKITGNGFFFDLENSIYFLHGVALSGHNRLLRRMLAYENFQDAINEELLNKLTDQMANDTLLVIL